MIELLPPDESSGKFDRLKPETIALALEDLAMRVRNCPRVHEASWRVGHDYENTNAGRLHCLTDYAIYVSIYPDLKR